MTNSMVMEILFPSKFYQGRWDERRGRRKWGEKNGAPPGGDTVSAGERVQLTNRLDSNQWTAVTLVIWSVEFHFSDKVTRVTMVGINRQRKNLRQWKTGLGNTGYIDSYENCSTQELLNTRIAQHKNVKMRMSKWECQNENVKIRMSKQSQHQKGRVYSTLWNF